MSKLYLDSAGIEALLGSDNGPLQMTNGRALKDLIRYPLKMAISPAIFPKLRGCHINPAVWFRGKLISGRFYPIVLLG